MLIAAQKVMIFFLDFAVCHQCIFLKVYPISLHKINSRKRHLFLPKKLNVLWMISVWNKVKCHFIYKIKMEFHVILILFKSVASTASFSLENTARFIPDLAWVFNTPGSVRANNCTLQLHIPTVHTFTHSGSNCTKYIRCLFYATPSWIW